MGPTMHSGTLGPAGPVVDHTELSPSGPFRALKQFGLVLLCAAWVCFGLIGHDPWKTEDAITVGVAADVMRGASPIAPTLAGERFLDEPPLIYALAGWSGRAFSPWLAPHDAARLVVGALLAGILLLISTTARELSGRSVRWIPVLVFIGCLGLWDRAHQLAPEVGLMLGVALAFYGFALGLRRPLAGGALLGTGVAVAFLADGFLGPLWVAVTAVLLPLAGAPWRNRRYALTLGLATIVALLPSLAWLVALAVLEPDHLTAWWEVQSIGTYFAPLAPTGWVQLYLPKNLHWFTWPALPLALWALYTRGRGFNGGWRTPAVLLPGMLSVAVFLCLLLMPEPRAIDAISLLVPLSVLGALEVDTLPRGFSGALDWFGILTFGLVAALAWGAWWDAYVHGMSPAIARLLRDTEAGYHPSFRGRAVIASIIMSALWLALVRPARRSNRRAILNWAAGVTLIWTLYMTIWLPYLDSRRSYRHLAEDIAAQIPIDSCLASRNLGQAQRALFYYFSAVRTVREEVEPVHLCRMLLVQYGRQDVDAPPEGWLQLWEGRRRGDDTERYVVYVRDGEAGRASSLPAPKQLPRSGAMAP